MEEDYEDNDEEDSWMLCSMIKCKCGKSVLCMFGTNKDGDLIEHSGCKLNAKNQTQGVQK